jgi:hypothetical protein
MGLEVKFIVDIYCFLKKKVVIVGSSRFELETSAV